MKRVITNRWFFFVAGVVVGALAFVSFRMALYNPPNVHYHANFAVYINGQQEQFKGSRYYEEETASCSLDHAITPQERAHMHDNINNLIHVHDTAVTWGAFFNNLGWALSTHALVTTDGTVYAETGSSKVHIILNGQDLTDIGTIAARVIADQDRLLVSYGDVTDAMLKQEASSVAATAHQYDTDKDPASCSGGKDISLGDRFSHIFN